MTEYTAYIHSHFSGVAYFHLPVPDGDDPVVLADRFVALIYSAMAEHSFEQEEKIVHVSPRFDPVSDEAIAIAKHYEDMQDEYTRTHGIMGD